MARLLGDADARRFVTTLTDDVLRSRDPTVTTAGLASLVTELGVPRGIGWRDRLALRLGARLGSHAPSIVAPLVRRRVLAESRGLLHRSDDRSLTTHLARRRGTGFVNNVNLLGEAVLGDADAERRVERLLALIARPDVDHLSVKISAVCAQLHPIAFDTEVDRVAIQLGRLFTAARARSPRCLVTVDMEEYRDLALATAAFRGALDRDDLGDLDAGIVLQAYLPDSLETLRELNRWARGRYRRAGGRLKVRLVKGANLAMEQVEAELYGWPQAPLPTKAAVDANYKRLLDEALDPAWSASVRVGAGSHNLFELAWALETANDLDASDRLDVELLEGMSDAHALALLRDGARVLLYTPIVDADDTAAAIAYLVRRLDENTAPDNFLRHVFGLAPGSPEWRDQEARFRASVPARHEAPPASQRRQDRAREVRRFEPDARFSHEPETDWTSAANRAWLAEHLARSGSMPDDDRERVAEPRDVEATITVARSAQAEWFAQPRAARHALLAAVAERIAAARGDIIATLAHDAGKVANEADAEVSEAIDLARWYGAAALDSRGAGSEGCCFHPHPLVVVAPPWNFPYAIAAGGVFAALAAGSAVILKPAPETVATGRLLARHCWSAGIPRDVLTFLPCPDEPTGRVLITHPGVDAVILTGSHATAHRFLEWRPDLHLYGETSGKNALVVTARADLDDAIRDLVRSAFGHAGQKCSAASLGIVEASVYDDDAFRRRLADAVRTVRVGDATDPANVVGPLILPPSGVLHRALTQLDPGEAWLVEPEPLDAGGRLWRPGVKLGVRPGSDFARHECFGPVLGLVRADDLDHAISIQNDTPFGLTGGIHSLDPSEVRRWLAEVDVGNAYVNRAITGAVVERQPFGGWKRSSVGATAKAGGPDYVATLGRWSDRFPPDLAGTHRAFDAAWASTYGRPIDRAGLWCEHNVLRYRSLPRPVLLRVGPTTPTVTVAIARHAATTTGTALEVSCAVERPDLDAPVTVEDDRVVSGRVATFSRLRLLTSAPDALLAAAHVAGVVVDDQPIVSEPAVELPRWLRAQAVSITAHRHGTPTWSVSDLLDERGSRG